MKIVNSMLMASILGITANATTLKEMINSALENNKNIKSYSTLNRSKQKNYQSVKNVFNPTLSIGANYLKLNGDTRNTQIEDTTTGYVKLGVNLYDGGKSSALKLQKNYEYQSSIQDIITTKKDAILQIVTLFFQAKTVIENIKVLEEKSNALKAQYDRIHEKYNLQMATQDEVLKLKSEYETNQYSIQELQYNKEELLQTLSLVSGKIITKIDSSTLPDIKNLAYKSSSSVKAMNLNLKAQDSNVAILSSVNKPQIKIEDTQNYYDYDNYNAKLLKDLPDQQNQLMVSINFKLFDTITSSKIQSAKLATLAMQQKLNYQKEYEKTKFNLAKRKLQIQKHKITSLKSAVDMGNSVYDMVKIKYKNGLVDNITYLDALSKKIYNLALYKQALNDYEIAKANYYFASGVEYEKILENF